MTETLQSVLAPVVERSAGTRIEKDSATPQTTIKRILFVTPRYLPTVGGVQHHVSQVSSRMAQAGIDVTVLTTNPGERFPEQEVIEGVRIRRVPAWPANGDFYFAPQVYPFIRNGSWDIIHVQSYHTFVAPMAMWAAWRSGIPYVTTFHGGGHSSRLRNSIRGVQQMALRPLLAHAEKLVAISDSEIPMFSKRLRLPVKQFALIPNGGDLPTLAEGEKVPVEEGLLVSIGRLEKYKGHQRVIAALPKILEQRPDARLWIAGVGPYQEKLMELARQLGVADRVDIHAIPAAHRQTMARELSRAALVVLLSEFETHPIAILEALSLGRPALVADAPGLRELAQKGWVHTISLNSSPAQVAEAVVEQLMNPQKPVKVDLTTWDECTKGLLALYSSIVAGRQPCIS